MILYTGWTALRLGDKKCSKSLENPFNVTFRIGELWQVGHSTMSNRRGKMPALASSGKQQQCPRDRRVVVMLRRWLLLVSLAKSCVAPIPELPIPELPELPAVPVPVAAPDKLYDGPLSPFIRAFVVSSLW